jgi:hypothetical protein
MPTGRQCSGQAGDAVGGGPDDHTLRARVTAPNARREERIKLRSEARRRFGVSNQRGNREKCDDRKDAMWTTMVHEHASALGNSHASALIDAVLPVSPP